MSDLFRAAVREMIEARREHYREVREAFFLCVVGSPDVPTTPQFSRLHRWEAAEEQVKVYLKGEEGLAAAVRAVFACFASGRVISRSYREDDSPEVVAANKKVTTDWVEEHRAAWARLCAEAGCEPIDWGHS